MSATHLSQNGCFGLKSGISNEYELAFDANLQCKDLFIIYSI